ncbi:MAG: nitroreductase family protein [Arcanobacterium sp.]|nr:nitroreductase family protein [Arcanobacterium sp.]
MNATSSTIEHQLAHRSIRKWTDEPLDEVLPTLLEVASRTASSHNFQMAGIIRITDPQIRIELATIAQQPYLAKAPELWIFHVDASRNARIGAEANAAVPAASSADAFFQGFTDAVLMAQNVVNAAESLGLGTVFFGSIQNDAEAVCRLLKMPELVFPAVGLGIGYPAQDPILKPRIPVELRLSENAYSAPESWHEALAQYDTDLIEYYKARNPKLPQEGFTTQVAHDLAGELARRFSIAEFARKQGFDL